jgi:hypothetical protein
MTAKYAKYLPPIIITPEMIKAWREKDFPVLRILIDWKPWEFCPLTTVRLWKPGPKETPQHYRTSPYNRSWWKAAALAERLEELAERQETQRRPAKSQRVRA